MENFRKYGQAPFGVAVIHGGPGAPGEMAPVASELSVNRGVLEPLQAGSTVEGQVEELEGVLRREAEVPAVVVGFSWGALLGFILAARAPVMVKKLVLVSSPPFEDGYAANIMSTRLSRLTEPERRETESLLAALGDVTTPDKDSVFARLGALLSKADSYEALSGSCEAREYQHEVYRSVWGEVERLRSTGRLVGMSRQIQCPVVAIHGAHDPHPGSGVKEPLTRALKDFRFIVLANCGHRPWLEKQARAEFFEVLAAVLE